MTSGSKTQISSHTFKGTNRLTNFGSFDQYSTTQVSYPEAQYLLISQGNKRSKGHYRGGGIFSVVKQEIHSAPAILTAEVSKYQNTQTGLTSLYDGHVLPFVHSTGYYPDAKVWTANELLVLGTKGFRRTIPTEPESNVGQFLAELRDLPKLPFIHNMKSKAAWFKKLGSEYLNVEFGWKPFVRDIQQATEATLQSKKNVAQFVRDSGKTVRRSRSLGTTVRTTQYNDTATGMQPSSANYVVTGGSYSYVNRYVEKQWFVGCYTYYIADVGKHWYSPSSIKRGEQIANKLYGTRITPGLLWDLAPWSWMADYFGNVGDIIHNFSSFNSDNLVCKYGYLMTKSTATRTYTQKVRLQNGKNGGTAAIAFVKQHLSRQVASPYGFGTQPALNAKQLAILGALGISR